MFFFHVGRAAGEGQPNNFEPKRGVVHGWNHMIFPING